MAVVVVGAALACGTDAGVMRCGRISNDAVDIAAAVAGKAVGMARLWRRSSPSNLDRWGRTCHLL